MIAPEAMEAFKNCSPSLQNIEIISGAGHFVQQEQAEKFNSAILDFLGE